MKPSEPRPTDPLLIDAVRTPFGKNRGGLSGVRTDDLAAVPLRSMLARHRELDPEEIDDVYLGNTNGAGEDNRNVARMAALLAELPVSVPGVTVNRLCASGNEAILQASRAIALGDAEIVLAGGVESMSRAPFVIQRPDEAFPRALEVHPTVVGWRMINPRFPAEWTASLGACAESSAKEHGVSREEMDEWAFRSHIRAADAWERGLHDDWVTEIAGVERDEGIRSDTSLDALAKLPAAFTSDGCVTAGNSSPISDGALALLMAARSKAASQGWESLGRIIATATVGVEPDQFARAPVPAINQVLRRTGYKLKDVSVVELQEAFAAVVCVCLRELEYRDEERVNPNGGAIAIGHPLGASAPRLVADACRELRRRGGGIGLVGVCIGVGLGQAILLEVS